MTISIMGSVVCFVLLMMICLIERKDMIHARPISYDVDNSQLTGNYSVPMLTVSLNFDKDGYLKSLLDSVDHMIDKIHIQIGNNDPLIVKDILSTIEKKQLESPWLHIESNVLDYNPGSARGFNFGLRHMMTSPSKPEWVLVVNNDIAFYPGVLRYISTQVYGRLASDPKFGIAFINLCCGGEWAAVIFTRRMVEKVGYLDENFYPAYYEDDDYGIRISLSPYKAVRFAKANVTHGRQDGSKKYVSGVESTLIGRRKVLNGSQLAWRRCFRQGIEYSRDYIRNKWGIQLAATTIRPICKSAKGINRLCYVGYSHPFNDTTKDITHWTLNQTRFEYLLKVGNGTIILKNK